MVTREKEKRLGRGHWHSIDAYTIGRGRIQLTEEVLTPQAVEEGGVSGAGGVWMNSNESSETDSPIVSRRTGDDDNEREEGAKLVSCRRARGLNGRREGIWQREELLKY